MTEKIGPFSQRLLYIKFGKIFSIFRLRLCYKIMLISGSFEFFIWPFYFVNVKVFQFELFKNKN